MLEQLNGTIVSGKGLGREYGFRTANVSLHDEDISLEAGTYKVSCVVNNQLFSGIGPYFPDKKLFEVHLFETEQDMYKQEAVIIPLHKIRENICFESIELLQEQIREDISWIENNPRTVMTFGTFDHVHPGHEAYLQQARQYGDNLVTVIARDTTVRALKKHEPKYNEEERLHAVEDLGIADEVILGDIDNHYACLVTYSPQVIYLGYDQHSFDDKLQEFYEEQDLELPYIIRGNAFEPDKRKSSYFR